MRIILPALLTLLELGPARIPNPQAAAAMTGSFEFHITPCSQKKKAAITTALTEFVNLIHLTCCQGASASHNAEPVPPSGNMKTPLW